MAAIIRIDGLTELAGALEAEWAQAATRGAEAVEKTARKIEGTAKSLAPRRTGALANSIRTDGSGTFREVGPTERYGRFMEFGTYKDAPQPFMGPAADQHEDDLVRELEGLVGNL